MGASVAHEIRNPLAGIKGALQVFSGGNLTAEETGEIAGAIHELVDRIDLDGVDVDVADHRRVFPTVAHAEHAESLHEDDLGGEARGLGVSRDVLGEARANGRLVRGGVANDPEREGLAVHDLVGNERATHGGDFAIDARREGAHDTGVVEVDDG